MRITALSAYFFIILGALDSFCYGLFGFRISGEIFGYATFLQRLFFCIVGVSAVFFIVFAILYKPFKSLSK
ncbi:MAG: DUF378 domain-containing protein [Clostridia bacterium]|nr:DUF378 domain-containing protein [Clostridia bacterium]